MNAKKLVIASILLMIGRRAAPSGPGAVVKPAKPQPAAAQPVVVMPKMVLWRGALSEIRVRRYAVPPRWRAFLAESRKNSSYPRERTSGANAALEISRDHEALTRRRADSGCRRRTKL
jgi:hypothetical protein